MSSLSALFILQTGASERQLYVVPCRDSNDRHRYLWLLITASYGSVSASTKFWVHCDHMLLDPGLQRVIKVPNLFYFLKSRHSVALMANDLYDVLYSEECEMVNQLLSLNDSKFQFGIAVHKSGILRTFGLDITKNVDATTIVEASDKLKSLEPVILPLVR